MPSSVPLTNAIAQNSVDFNSQTPTNASGLFRYKINNRVNNHVFTDADLNSVCIFSGGGSITNVFLGTGNFSGVPPVGAEIIFYSTTGNIKINLIDGAILAGSVGPFTPGAYSAGKIIHIGNNVWYFASANAAAQPYNWTNCCGESAATQLYQISVAGGFNPALTSYFDSNVNYPYNGHVNDGTNLYYKVVNGVWNNTTISDCNDTKSYYTNQYNFYDAPDPIYGNTVPLYSVGGLNPASPETLMGNKFFISDVGQQFDCYAPNTVSDSTYYTSTTAPYYALTFRYGYVTSYTYTPGV